MVVYFSSYRRVAERYRENSVAILDNQSYEFSFYILFMMCYKCFKNWLSGCGCSYTVTTNTITTGKTIPDLLIHAKSRDNKIKKIYEVIACKEIKFWTKLERKDNWHYATVVDILENENWNHNYVLMYKKSYSERGERQRQTGQDIENTFNVIWNKIYLWDVLYWCENNFHKSKRHRLFDTLWFVLDWHKTREPLEEQEVSLINYVYEFCNV